MALRELSTPLMRGVEIVLVSDTAQTFNPAMSSGLLRGAYKPREACVEVAMVCARAGARLVPATLEWIDVKQRVVAAGAEHIPFDVCSLDIVGSSEGADSPGVAKHSLTLRPPSLLPRVRAQIEQYLANSTRSIACAIVGGGTLGVETAFVLERLLGESKHGGVVTIVDERSTILAGNSACRDTALRALEGRGVCFALGARAVQVTDDAVHLSAGGILPADLVLWATGGAPPRAIAASGLPHDASGRLVVDASLRAQDGAPVWGAGDCVARDHGRDAADQGALLAASLRAGLDASRRPPVVRSKRAPCLLDTGDGRALVAWAGIQARSRWGWWLKQRRDRRFVAELGRP